MRITIIKTRFVPVDVASRFGMFAPFEKDIVPFCQFRFAWAQERTLCKVPYCYVDCKKSCDS